MDSPAIYLQRLIEKGLDYETNSVSYIDISILSAYDVGKIPEIRAKDISLWENL